MGSRKKLAIVYIDGGAIEDQLPELKEIALRRDREALVRWYEEHEVLYFQRADYSPSGASPSSG